MPAKKLNHYLGYLLLAASTQAMAADAEDAIADCARISSTGDRILCLEDALRRVATAESTAESAMPAPEADAVPAAVVPVAAAGTVVAADEKNPAKASEAPAVAATPPPAVAAKTVAVAGAVELGAEQVADLRDEEEESVRISAKIVSHELVGTGRLRLTLDNEQIWQQTGDDDDGIARKIRGDMNIDVEMWQSKSGGYRMYIVGIDRTLRVRRIR